MDEMIVTTQRLGNGDVELYVRRPNENATTIRASVDTWLKLFEMVMGQCSNDEATVAAPSISYH